MFYFSLRIKTGENKGQIRDRDVDNFLKTLNDTLAIHIPGFLDKKIKYTFIGKEDSEEEATDIMIMEIEEKNYKKILTR